MARFANTIDNQPIYAARAEADKNGDRIDTTYLKVADLPAAPVQDVEVDGTSVVNAQGVAEITMPTVPTATSELTNDSGFITASDVAANQAQADWTETSTSSPSYIQHKPDLSIYAQSANLATVATSGNYNDLSNLPTIPPAVTVDQHYDAQSSNPQSGAAVAEALSGTGQVPTVTSSDDSKVLTATYSGGQGSYSWQPASASTQVNADWEATSGVAEILHKPDLSVYAETADLATVATTGDYDDLVDAPTIVGLAAGANVTITEANNTVTIAATDTTYTAGNGISISGGAISNSDPIPSHTSTQSGKVLGVDSNGDLDWVTPAASQVQANWNETDTSAASYIQNKPTIPTVDQTYNALSTNAQSGTAVAGALSGISQVPSTSGQTAGNVLTVDQYGEAAWVAPSAQTQADWTESDPTEVSYIQHKPSVKPLVAGQNVVLTEGANNITIDCTASGGGSTYTAGAGIAITGSEISVNYDRNTLDTVASTVTITAAGTPEAYDSHMHITDAGFTSLLNSQTSANVTVHIPSGFFSNSPYFTMSGYQVYLSLYTADPRNGGQPAVYTNAPLSYQYDSLNDEYVIDEQDVVLSLPASGADWYPGTSLNFTDPYIVIVIAPEPDRGEPVPVTDIAAESSTCTITYTSAGSQALTVKNPLPASTSADEGKCLVVDSNGDPEWGTGGKTYTGTDGVVVDNVNDTVGLEAPVDIVAGPGIVIDNPDGNTLRVSVAVNERVTLWEATALTDHTTSCNLSESMTNFEQIQVMFQTNNNNTFFYTYPGNTSFMPIGAVVVGNNTTVFHKYATFSITNDRKTLTRQYCCEHSNANTPSASDVIWLYKVVGIHRINGGN